MCCLIFIFVAKNCPHVNIWKGLWARDWLLMTKKYWGFSSNTPSPPTQKKKHKKNQWIQRRIWSYNECFSACSKVRDWYFASCLSRAWPHWSELWTSIRSNIRVAYLINTQGPLEIKQNKSSNSTEASGIIIRLRTLQCQKCPVMQALVKSRFCLFVLCNTCVKYFVTDKDPHLITIMISYIGNTGKCFRTKLWLVLPYHIIQERDHTLAKHVGNN